MSHSRVSPPCDETTEELYEAYVWLAEYLGFAAVPRPAPPSVTSRRSARTRGPPQKGR